MDRFKIMDLSVSFAFPVYMTYQEFGQPSEVINYTLGQFYSISDVCI
jgi:hypothetical protein